MKSIKMVDGERFGGGDGKAINRHSSRTYEVFDDQGISTRSRVFIDRDLDLDPPSFTACGPIKENFRGVIPSLDIPGLDEARSWQAAEKLLDEAISKMDREPAIIFVCSLSTKAIKERLSAMDDKRPGKVFHFPEAETHPAIYVPQTCQMIRDETEVPIYVGTHSSDLINAMGRMFDGGELAQEDLRIDIIHEDGNITSHGFDDHGRLTDWPIGFFSPYLDLDEEKETASPFMS